MWQDGTLQVPLPAEDKETAAHGRVGGGGAAGAPHRGDGSRAMEAAAGPGRLRSRLPRGPGRDAAEPGSAREMQVRRGGGGGG